MNSRALWSIRVRGVSSVSCGQHVTANPVIPCGRCRTCQGHAAIYCQRSRFLGVDLDGACADYVRVPESAVYPIPADMSFLVAAFAEPVAASLAVIKAQIQPHQTGLILGNNRIAKLTHRVLRAFGFDGVSICDEAAATDIPDNSVDFVIETLATSATVVEMVRLVRPRGRIVFKSRQFQPINLVLRDILLKEPVFEAVNYGAFDDAIHLLATGHVSVEDLIGKCYSLEQFDEAVASGFADEAKKTFLISEQL